jgi:hypothetical protein
VPPPRHRAGSLAPCLRNGDVAARPDLGACADAPENTFLLFQVHWSALAVKSLGESPLLMNAVQFPVDSDFTSSGLSLWTRTLQCGLGVLASINMSGLAACSQRTSTYLPQVVSTVEGFEL